MARAQTHGPGNPASRGIRHGAAPSGPVAAASTSRWGRLRTALHRALRIVREIVGAPDYERYLEHHARCHPGRAPLDPRAFYAEFTAWRFGGGRSRCC